MQTRTCLGLAAIAFALLAGCGQQERVREIDWAKAALARNPAYEIVATDESAGVFTVRDTTTGTVHTLRLEELIAAPLPPRAVVEKTAAQAAPPAAPAEPAPAPAAAPATLAANQTTGDEITEHPGPGAALAEGPGYRITRGAAREPASSATIEGPGYSITRQEPQQHATASAEESLEANVERRSDPIICQGDRLMRIDGETIEFTGDAVIAEKGCDLYISNARIRAGGVGIIARQARVHIVNSTIGGTRGSYEASEGAEIYVARSTFAGIGRRFDTATMNDLGGNAYEAQ